LDEVHVGLLHLPQELPGVGGQALDVAPLALGVDGVEGQRALAGARDAREHDELAPGKVEGDVLQVVLTGTVNDEPLSGTHNDVILEAGVKPFDGGGGLWEAPPPMATREELEKLSSRELHDRAGHLAERRL